ncbi:MAG TPA: PDZ domain-containing protein, partial [Pseudothermotoga sp.]|nr:PDZ domain-containing protein [Pseudothermotoga sp.]
KAYLGVRLMTVTEDLAKAMGLKVNQGVLVVQVLENSPADKAKLQENDVIVKFDNVSVTSDAELVSLIHSHVPGDVVTIVVNRSGKEITLTVTLGSSVEEDTEPTQAAQEFLGLIVDEITGSDRESYSIPASLSGVIVRQVKNTTQIQKGDVIYQMAVNGKNHSVNSVKDWNNVVSKIKQGDFVAIFVYRKGAKMIYSFTYR